MSNKTNIEEDIKIANAIVKVNKDYLKDVENQTINQREIQAIENILADRENYKALYERALNDLVQAEAKANKYDSLVEKMEDKIIRLKEYNAKLKEKLVNAEMGTNIQLIEEISKIENQIKLLQELLDIF